MTHVVALRICMYTHTRLWVLSGQVLQGDAFIIEEKKYSYPYLLFLHGLESNPGSSLQTEEEAGLP